MSIFHKSLSHHLFYLTHLPSLVTAGCLLVTVKLSTHVSTEETKQSSWMNGWTINEASARFLEEAARSPFAGVVVLPSSPSSFSSVSAIGSIVSSSSAAARGGGGGGGGSVTDDEDDDDPEARLMIHFSTDCTSFQHWQALVLLEAAAKVGQKGAITRVVSGCERQRSLTGEPQLTPEKIRADHEYMMAELEPAFRFHLYFFEDMTAIGNGTSRYKFANKAHTLHHWLDEEQGGTYADCVEGGSAEDHDVAIVSIDPDFIFMKAFNMRELGLLTSTKDEEGEVVMVGDEEGREERRMTGREVVQQLEGKPVAQAYGLGTGWLNFNLKEICGVGSNCAKVDGQEAIRHYNVGPPYVLHRKDWIKMLDVWTPFIVKVYDAYLTVDGPNKDPTRHYAEMFAWAMAAAHLNLPHRLLEDVMIGCMRDYPSQLMREAIEEEEGGRPMRCGVDSVVGRHSSPSRLPAFLHYCQKHVIKGNIDAQKTGGEEEERVHRGRVDRETGGKGKKKEESRKEGEEEERVWKFYKRFVPHDLITDCGRHALELPPVSSFDATNEDNFIVCTMIAEINSSKRRYRQAACDVGGEEGEEEGEMVYDIRLYEGGGSRLIGKGETT